MKIIRSVNSPHSIVKWRNAAMALAICSVSFGADDSGKNAQLEEILRELQSIRKVLENSSVTRDGQRPSDRIRISTKQAPFLGSRTAPISIVALTDYECPFCQRFHAQTFHYLKKHYIDTGRVGFYSLDFPLENHKNAMVAAQAGQCANDQGQFWSMYDKMQAAPNQLDRHNLMEYAKEANLDVVVFRQCLESERHKGSIQQLVAEITEKGVRGTPAFVIGRAGDNEIEGELIFGAVPLGIFEKKIKEILKTDVEPPSN